MLVQPGDCECIDGRLLGTGRQLEVNQRKYGNVFQFARSSIREFRFFMSQKSHLPENC